MNRGTDLILHLTAQNSISGTQITIALLSQEITFAEFKTVRESYEKHITIYHLSKYITMNHHESTIHIS